MSLIGSIGTFGLQLFDEALQVFRFDVVRLHERVVADYHHFDVVLTLDFDLLSTADHAIVDKFQSIPIPFSLDLFPTCFTADFKQSYGPFGFDLFEHIDTSDYALPAFLDLSLGDC